ncbi:MAG: M14 family metallopeptidase [Gammaproteobacteria bacterium]|nr:M14 family metallopeptidase [Gammaproteobacteria bacterium]
MNGTGNYLMLNEMTTLPDGFLDAKPDQLKAMLGSPTLIHLQGKNPRPLFVSTLLHGNESSGLFALQAVLKSYEKKPLPRSLSLFIGNVSAAEQDQRVLEGQPDYNRVWPGTDHADCQETRLMQQVVDIMKKHKPFASIDLHNNTGRNPHYGCVNRVSAQYLQLARLFSHTVVYFTTPIGVQSQAFSAICPAVTLECGKVGELDGISHASRYLDTVLQLDNLPDHNPTDIDLLHTVARVTVNKEMDFSFDGSAEIKLEASIELYNFREVKENTEFAEVSQSESEPFEVQDEQGNNVYESYFKAEGDKIILKKTVIPAMFTRNIDVIRQDCLCYLMEHFEQ